MYGRNFVEMYQVSQAEKKTRPTAKIDIKYKRFRFQTIDSIYIYIYIGKNATHMNIETTGNYIHNSCRKKKELTSKSIYQPNNNKSHSIMVGKRWWWWWWMMIRMVMRMTD